MPLPPPARFALMLGEPAWQRAAFDANTALVDGVVQLAWESRGEGGVPLAVDDVAGAGLAFDAACRLYQSLPGEQRVQRWLWSELDPARPQQDPPPADVLVIRFDGPQVIGALPAAPEGFVPAPSPLPSLLTPTLTPTPTPTPTPAFTPRALACDDEGHLYVLDSADLAVMRVWVVDLVQRRVLHAVAVPADAVHMAWQGAWLWVLCASGALQQVAADGTVRLAPVSASTAASRLAFAEDGRLYVLHHAHTAAASKLKVVAIVRREIDGATAADNRRHKSHGAR